VLDVVLQAIEFAQQQRLRGLRVTTVREGLGRPQRRPVHHLEASGHDPRRHDASDRAGAARDVVEPCHQKLDALGQRHETHRDLDHHAQHALGAGDQRQQRQPRLFSER
jgi:hypothetical protein